MTAEDRTPGAAASEVGALPRGTTVLHIGAPKTGTTSLQQSAAVSRGRLREGGVMYPGRYENHRRFARALLGYRKEPWLTEPAPAHWATGILNQLVNNERDYALVSSEAFSTADARDVVPVREAFTMPTHVVLTLRPLPGMLLSMWQQRVKNGEFGPLDAWLDDAFRELPMLHMSGGDVFDESDGTNLVGRWADAFGPENMTVVVLDPTDRDHIFRVFEGLLALRRGTLERVSANSSMSAVETEFFRQAGERIFRETGSRARRGLFHGGAVNAVIAERPRRADEPSLRVPEWVTRGAATAAMRIAEQIESAGVRVVGDLTDLAAAGRVGDPEPFPDQVPSDLALVAAGGLARRVVKLRGPGAETAPAPDVDPAEDPGGAGTTLLVTGAPGSCADAVRRGLVPGNAEALVSEAAWSFTADEIRALPAAQDGSLRAVVVVEPPAVLAVRSWQDAVTRGAAQDLDGFLTDLLAGTGASPDGGPSLHRDPVGPWVEALGADHVTVVVPRGETTGDRRLSAVEAELLGALYEHLAGDRDLAEADVRRLRSSAVRRILDARIAGPDEGTVGVPQWALGRLREIGQALAGRIAAHGAVRTEGDLADLAADPLPGRAAASRSERIPTELALQAVIGVYEGARRLC